MVRARDVLAKLIGVLKKERIRHDQIAENQQILFASLAEPRVTVHGIPTRIVAQHATEKEVRRNSIMRRYETSKIAIVGGHFHAKSARSALN